MKVVEQSTSAYNRYLRTLSGDNIILFARIRKIVHYIWDDSSETAIILPKGTRESTWVGDESSSRQVFCGISPKSTFLVLHPVKGKNIYVDVLKD